MTQAQAICLGLQCRCGGTGWKFAPVNATGRNVGKRRDREPCPDCEAGAARLAALKKSASEPDEDAAEDSEVAEATLLQEEGAESHG